MWTHTKRIIKTGFLNFLRNGFVSLSSVLVITITLFVIGSMVFFSAIMDASLTHLKDKVDVDVYFTTNTLEEEILSLKTPLEELPEVAFVSYTSREEALEQFKERHEDDFLTLQALEELNDNPLGASLNIRAKETSQYASIARFLENKQELGGQVNQIIDKINYYQNKPAIDKLTSVIEGSRLLGALVIAVLVVTAIIITLNTVRLAIFTSREEIAVMKLVGADNKYIRGPFIVEGVIYGVISGLIVLGLFYPLTFWLGPKTVFFGGLNIFDYYTSHFLQMFAIVVFSGVALGVLSSYVSVQRYLRKKYLKVL